MPGRSFTLSTEQISTDVAHYVIGLVTVAMQNGVEEATCAGSGSLVTVGSLHGILTAAHVLDALPKQGAVGVVLRVKAAAEFHKQIITMEHTDSLTIRGAAFGPLGQRTIQTSLSPKALRVQGKVEVVDRRLLGVPFYQTFAKGGKREIVCHGPRGIYGALIDKVKAK